LPRDWSRTWILCAPRSGQEFLSLQAFARVGAKLSVSSACRFGDMCSVPRDLITGSCLRLYYGMTGSASCFGDFIFSSTTCWVFYHLSKGACLWGVALLLRAYFCIALSHFSSGELALVPMVMVLP
jgi:hypothetical protein